MKVRWEDAQFRVYVDGVELGVYSFVNFSFEETAEVDEAKYQGSSRPSLDAHYRGGRGTAEFRVDDDYANPQAAYDAYISGVKTRDGTGRIRIVATHRAPGSQSRIGRRFDNCQLQHSERDGENQAKMVTWSFQYENSVAI